MGLTREEVEGRSLTAFIEPFDSKLLFQTILDPLEKGRVVLPIFTLKRGNGTFIQVEASSHIIERDGISVGVQMVLRDINGRSREILQTGAVVEG